MTTRTLSQALQDFGIVYEYLRDDVATTFGKTRAEAVDTITNAHANGELEVLLYEMGY